MVMQRKEQQAALNGAPSAEFAATETWLPSQKTDKETKNQGNQFYGTGTKSRLN